MWELGAVEGNNQECQTVYIYKKKVALDGIMKNSVVYSVVYPEQFMFRRVNHIKLLVTFNQEISVL